MLLKTCIFATGLSGIVAEYVMSTLAAYLLGNTILHWTLTISIMLFAMGVGSRLSQYIQQYLLDAFILIEFCLSILCAISASLAYFLYAHIQWPALLIYLLSFCIGLLIGLEIPLAARLNEYFEDLRINISSVMEKDYYGSLLGGLLFAFFALPYLGLTYTPIILGMVNFSVAAVLYLKYRNRLKYAKFMMVYFIGVLLLLIVLPGIAKPIIRYNEQKKYVDKVIYQEQTPYQRIVITQWKNNYWLYLNGNEQFSSYDEERYHEPLVHPAMQLSIAKNNILVLGGGDGLAAREILKYPDVQKIVLVDLDPAMTQLGQHHPLFLKLNQNSLNDSRIQIINQDAYQFLKKDNNIYDVIIIDLPDPNTIDLARLYTREFYQLAARHLSKGGSIVTQATSPFFARKAFLSILQTMRAAGIVAIGYHNHIPTLGEWGWVMGTNTPIHSKDLKKRLSQMKFDQIKTRFLNQDAMISMINFGKGELDDLKQINITHQLELAVYSYYKNGNWEIY